MVGFGLKVDRMVQMVNKLLDKIKKFKNWVSTVGNTEVRLVSELKVGMSLSKVFCGKDVYEECEVTGTVFSWDGCSSSKIELFRVDFIPKYRNGKVIKTGIILDYNATVYFRVVNDNEIVPSDIRFFK